jgi:hypothetical protein
MVRESCIVIGLLGWRCFRIYNRECDDRARVVVSLVPTGTMGTKKGLCTPLVALIYAKNKCAPFFAVFRGYKTQGCRSYSGSGICQSGFKDLTISSRPFFIAQSRAVIPLKSRMALSAP